MEDAVSAWKNARSFVLQMIAEREIPTQGPPSKKRKLLDSPESNTTVERETTSSGSSESPSNGLCNCPVCGKHVNIAEINEHIDRQCEDPKTVASSKSQWQNILGPKSQASDKGKGRRKGSRDPDTDEPLPKKSYGVLKDKQIRELLQEYDLPTQGDRNTMIARHSQWVTLFNANLDKSEKFRKSIEGLKKDLLQWEAQQQKSKAKRDIEDPAEYHKQQKSEFDRLVEAARPKKTIPKDDPGQVKGKGMSISRENNVIIVDND
ncbi:E3 ubiquitin-protein ligase rad18 [Paramarasmius palmivorus]|uniref:E3 ubiquitin-protein ligase rad18 n=1 Tax=Paramarasmius palmivorus TaxID=297713 RepID=A0AAW0DF53_9AGAR